MRGLFRDIEVFLDLSAYNRYWQNEIIAFHMTKKEFNLDQQNNQFIYMKFRLETSLINFHPALVTILSLIKCKFAILYLHGIAFSCKQYASRWNAQDLVLALFKTTEYV